MYTRESLPQSAFYFSRRLLLQLLKPIEETDYPNCDSTVAYGFRNLSKVLSVGINKKSNSNFFFQVLIRATLRRKHINTWFGCRYIYQDRLNTSI